MPILMCRAIPGQKKVYFEVQGISYRISYNIRVQEINSKLNCNEQLLKRYLKDCYYSEKRKYEIERRRKPIKKLDIAQTYQLVIKLLQKHL